MTVDGRRRPCQLLRRLFGMPVGGRARSRAEATVAGLAFHRDFPANAGKFPVLADFFPVTFRREIVRNGCGIGLS